MPTKLAHFTERVVLFAQKAVVGEPPAFQRGGGYADRVIVALYGLREYLDHPYRRLLDVVHEMPRIVELFGLELANLPDFSTLCARKQALKMPVWRVLLRLSADLHDIGEIQPSTQPASIESLPASTTRIGRITRSGRSKRQP